MKRKEINKLLRERGLILKRQYHLTRPSRNHYRNGGCEAEARGWILGRWKPGDPVYEPIQEFTTLEQVSEYLANNPPA